jgi:dihydroorotate dehydrogenase (NAD+) catalytic subunit
VNGSAPELAIEFAGLSLRNPVLAASGTFGYGLEMAPHVDLEKIGGFVAKSLTLAPRAGNPPPRISEASSGMLNSISLENVGVDAFLEEKLPQLPSGTTVIASIFGTEIPQYAEAAARLSAEPRIAAVEVNASCPHVASGGIEFGQRAEVLAELVRAVRRAASGTLLVKLSPNVTDIVEMARVCEEQGADGICLINAVQAMEVDIAARRPVLWNGLGGLSGPAIRPIALRMVWQCARAVGIPICGIGGVSSAEDVIKFLLCGARAVQVGTANYIDPGVTGAIVDSLAAHCEAAGVARIEDFVGDLAPPRW